MYKSFPSSSDVLLTCMCCSTVVFFSAIDPYVRLPCLIYRLLKLPSGQLFSPVGRIVLGQRDSMSIETFILHLSVK